MRPRRLTAAVMGAAVWATGLGMARADFTILATDDATVQPGGPRAGVNGKLFFNAEGSSNGAFASYGVAQFTFGPGAATSVTGLTLTLTQNNASFTHNGSLNFYLTTDTTTNLQPGTSPLVFNTAAPPAGIDGQLETTFLLGTATFTQGTNVVAGQSPGFGTVDTYTFMLTAAEQAYLISQINATGPIRIIMAPGDATVSATYSGFNNASPGVPGPRLTVTGNAVPEPAALISAAIGLALLSAFACRRRTDSPLRLS